jgi:hypothetical protein
LYLSPGPPKLDLVRTSGRSHHTTLTLFSLFPLFAFAQPRCPQFDAYVTGNDGKSFQAGCGYDPIDTGKWIRRSGVDSARACYNCRSNGVSVRLSLLQLWTLL